MSCDDVCKYTEQIRGTSKQRRETQTSFLIRISRASFCSMQANMPLICLLWFFTTPGALSADFRGNFVPPQTSPSLVEGDIAVPETHLGTGLALDAFLTEPTALWPRGFIPYRIETFEWDGVVEPIFLDEQIENITLAQRKIMTDVPCLKFQ